MNHCSQGIIQQVNSQGCSPTTLSPSDCIPGSLDKASPPKHVRFSLAKCEGNGKQHQVRSRPSLAASEQISDLMHPRGSGAEARIWTTGRPLQTPYANSITSNATYMRHLDLGDIASPQDMMLESDPNKIESMQKHDFAFVRRGCGDWTYAIIANREEDHILFVLDREGSTKALSRRHWCTCIRPVNTTSSPRSMSHLAPLASLGEAFSPPPFRGDGFRNNHVGPRAPLPRRDGFRKNYAGPSAPPLHHITVRSMQSSSSIDVGSRAPPAMHRSLSSTSSTSIDALSLFD